LGQRDLGPAADLASATSIHLALTAIMLRVGWAPLSPVVAKFDPAARRRIVPCDRNAHTRCCHQKCKRPGEPGLSKRLNDQCQYIRGQRSEVHLSYAACKFSAALFPLRLSLT